LILPEFLQLKVNTFSVKRNHVGDIKLLKRSIIAYMINQLSIFIFIFFEKNKPRM